MSETTRNMIKFNKKWIGLIGLSLSVLFILSLVILSNYSVLQIILCTGIVLTNIISMIMLVYEIKVSVKWKGELDKLINNVILNANNKEERNE